MESPELKRILESYAAAATLKTNWTTKWQECYDYALPNRAGFFGRTPGEDNTNAIFDSTAVQATAEFASRMQAGLTPPFAKWFEFKAGSEIPAAQRSEVDEVLEEVALYIWEILQASNMDQELHEGYLDLSVGTAAMLIEEGDITQPLKFTTIPQPQFVLAAGPYGMIDRFYRSRKMRVIDMQVVWPGISIPSEMLSVAQEKPEQTFEVIECVARDWQNKTQEKHDFNVICPEHKKIMFKSEFVGDGASPLVAFRWSKASGEVYGRGPLFNAMPDVKTLNMVVELMLENAHMAIAGMWQSDDNGVLNPDTIDLMPGTIIPRAPGSDGLSPLAPPGNFDVSQFIMQDMRTTIKKSLFNESLGAPEGTPMSATEVHERMADLARTIGSAYGRLHTELVTPLLRRVVYLLKKQGKIQIPLVNGREVKIINVSPLAQAQHNENVARVARWLELMNGGFGPQMTNVVTKANETASYVGKEIGIPEKLIRTDAEQEQIIQAIQNTAEQSQGQAAAQGQQGGQQGG